MKYLMNDLVVQEHVCNLRCTYCLNFENENLKDDTPWKPTARVTLAPGTEGRARTLDVLAATRAKSDAPILRVAGGEVMALPGAVDFIAEVAGLYDRVQVLTNAAFLTRDLDQLAEIPNLNLCCSLDGHTTHLNSLRTKKESLAQTIIDGVVAAIERGLPVEIYTVVTALNAAHLDEFAEWVYGLDRPGDVHMFPFPVRGKASIGHLPEPGDWDSIDRILADYERLAEVLPPRAYFERLRATVRGEQRPRCRLPLGILQTFDDGVLAACSNCWAAPLGNVLEDADAAFGNVGEANIHKLFLRTPPRVNFCDGCFTPFDMLNLFLDGDCTLEDMAGIDMYSSPAVQARLVELKDHWRDDAVRTPLRTATAPILETTV